VAAFSDAAATAMGLSAGAELLSVGPERSFG
jgi:hypothetical protein